MYTLAEILHYWLKLEYYFQNIEKRKGCNYFNTTFGNRKIICTAHISILSFLTMIKKQIYGGGTANKFESYA